MHIVHAEFGLYRYGPTATNKAEQQLYQRVKLSFTMFKYSITVNFRYYSVCLITRIVKRPITFGPVDFGSTVTIHG